MDALDFINSLEKILISEKSKNLKLFKKQKSKNHRSPIFHFPTLDYPKLSSYLNNFSSKELNSALNVYKTLSFNQKNLFLLAIDNNSYNYKFSKKINSFNSLERELWRIKKGIIPKGLIFHTGYATCDETIFGFIRAFKQDSVFSTKINIDGENRRVFIKTFVGLSKNPSENLGFSPLILDPKSFKIYNLAGISNVFSLKDTSKIKLSSRRDSILSLRTDPKSKNYVPALKEEMKNYLSRFKERTSFKERHKEPFILKEIKKESLKEKKSLFSRIKKKFVRK